MSPSRLLAALVCSALLLLAVSSGAPCAELKDTYKVRIVVAVKKHRLLTDIFRQQVARELRDGLKSALGDLAQVTVTENHPRLTDIQARGLGKALDGVRERGPERVYFVCIEWSGTDYRIETRMLDGLTGLASPIVRQASVRDTNRAYVARSATFLLERDLGLLGTVQSEPDRNRIVSLELRGGGLSGVDLGKWVKKGEVFSLVRVEGEAAGSPVPWSILRVVEPPKDGVCKCQLFSRYELRQVTGLRAVLLGTTSGPLRLRVMEEKLNRELGPLQSSVTLQVRRESFDEGNAVLTTTASQRLTLDTSTRREPILFDKVAFVKVLVNETPRARLPIPILDDRQVIAGIPGGNENEDLTVFRARMLARSVLDANQVQADMFRDINKTLSGKPELRAMAIKRVKDTLQRSRKDHSRLTADLEELEKSLEKIPQRNRPNSSGIKERLRTLKAGETDLENTIAALENIEKEENDPESREWQVQRQKALLLEKEGKVEEAIEIYEKAPEKFKNEDLKKHLEELQKLWAPSDNDDFKAARKVILKNYPEMTTAEKLTEGMPDVRKALDACKKAGDVIGPARLRKTTLEHVQRLADDAGKLQPSVNIDDEKPFKTIQDLIPQLRKLVEEIGDYLDKKKK